MIQTYKDLIVWQKAALLLREIYRVTRKFPKEERNIFTDQMRRAAVSVASNIAEGKGRPTRRAYAQYVTIAYGSIVELEAQIILAGSINLINKDDMLVLESIATEVVRMLRTLRRKLLDLPKPPNLNLIAS